jgi:hypothetical protein
VGQLSGVFHYLAACVMELGILSRRNLRRA